MSSARSTKPQDMIERTSPRGRKRNSSKQDRITRMPVELLTEAFSYLQPKDLINLVHVNRFFRDLMLNRRHAHMWRAARAQVDGLPDIPPFLSEPAFARLLYSNFCDGCGTRGIKKVEWWCFKRYCKACRKMNITDNWVPTVELRKDSDIHRMKFEDILSVFKQQPPGELYHIPQLCRFLEARKSTENSRAAKAQLYEDQKTRIVTMRMHAEVLERWSEAIQNERSDERVSAKTQRLDDICTRLREKGWGAEVKRLREGNSFDSKFPSLRKFGKLTDAGFDNVLRELTPTLRKTREILEKERRERIYDIRLQLLRNATQAYYVQIPRQPSMLWRPTCGDMANEPEIKLLIESPDSQVVAFEDFASLIPVVGPRWEDAMKAKLQSVVRMRVQGIPDDVDPLSLAVANFECYSLRCRDCNAGPQRYPALLAHPCFRAPRLRRKHEDEDQLQAAMLKLPKDAQPVNMRELESNTFWRSKALLAALQLRPETTTMQEVEQLRLRWTSWEDSSNRSVHTWYTALQAVPPEDLLAERRFSWRLATPEECAAAAAVPERPSDSPLVRLRDAKWVCALCYDWSGNIRETTEHFSAEHWHPTGEQPNFDIQRCISDGTVFLHPGTVYVKHAVRLPNPDLGSGPVRMSSEWWLS
ncbi:hypothetical protein FKP32DRAFT_1758890 [Trametes sanguinea]|nr:hypothetical protein FKP32DRAFT_1758890 [Trametes sanguinea]